MAVVLILLTNIRAKNTLNNNRRIDLSQEVPPNKTSQNNKLGDQLIKSLHGVQWIVHIPLRRVISRKLTVWMPERRANTHQCFVELVKMDKYLKRTCKFGHANSITQK